MFSNLCAAELPYIINDELIAFTVKSTHADISFVQSSVSSNDFYITDSILHKTLANVQHADIS